MNAPHHTACCVLQSVHASSMSICSGDLYAALGVQHGASLEEVRKAYRRQARALHPDKNPHDVQGATAKFQQLQAAFQALCLTQDCGEQQQASRHSGREEMKEWRRKEKEKHRKEEKQRNERRHRKKRLEEWLKRQKEESRRRRLEMAERMLRRRQQDEESVARQRAQGQHWQDTLWSDLLRAVLATLRHAILTRDMARQARLARDMARQKREKQRQQERRRQAQEAVRRQAERRREQRGRAEWARRKVEQPQAWFSRGAARRTRDQQIHRFRRVRQHRQRAEQSVATEHQPRHGHTHPQEHQAQERVT